MPTVAEMLLQMGDDTLRIFGKAPHADCRKTVGARIAVSGEQQADLNMITLAEGASRAAYADGLAAVRKAGVDGLLVVDEAATDVAGWAAADGLMNVGQLPFMERIAAPLEPEPTVDVRLATPADMERVAELAAQAFGLDATATRAVLPAALLDPGQLDVWVASEDGLQIGAGTFVRTGDHVGIYVMATPQAWQRRGVGRSILETAMAHYQQAGVTRFTLGATEQGYPLYERTGFSVVARPHIFVIGASTQFPGSH